jgi:endonuclease YncB( thermonuclease family)
LAKLFSRGKSPGVSSKGDEMWGHYQILLPLLSLLLVRVDLTDLFPLSMEVKVAQVLDGDTLELSSGNYRMRLRLSRIDAPEMDQAYLSGRESAGEYSKGCLKRLLKKQGTLRLEGFDQYQRMLGDFDQVNLQMIQLGCAVIYPFARFSSKAEKGRFLRAQNLAKLEGKGIWEKGILSPRKWRKLSKVSTRSAHRRSRR